MQRPAEGLRPPPHSRSGPGYGRDPVGNGHAAAGFSAVLAPTVPAADGIAAGAVIAVLCVVFKISPLAFALGMYIPQELNTPLLFGGIIAYLVSKSSKDRKICTLRSERTNQHRDQPCDSVAMGY